jgi:hypothetical protein
MVYYNLKTLQFWNILGTYDIFVAWRSHFAEYHSCFVAEALRGVVFSFSVGFFYKLWMYTLKSIIMRIFGTIEA